MSETYQLREPDWLDLASDHWKLQPRDAKGHWVKEGGIVHDVFRSTEKVFPVDPNAPHAPSHRAPTNVEALSRAARNAPAAAKVVYTAHKAFTELPPPEQREAVRELRKALYTGDDSKLANVDSQWLVRTAADTSQKAEIRAQAKKELAQRVQASAAAQKMTKKAALASLRAGESPNHWLGIEPDGATVFDKTLIRLHPRFAQAVFKFRGRLRKTDAYTKAYHQGRHAATRVQTHVGKTKEEVVFKGINHLAASGVALLAGYIGLHVLGDNETLKTLVDQVKDWADASPLRVP